MPDSKEIPANAGAATRERLRIFISSPGDVGSERDRAEAVVQAVDADLGDIDLEVVRWEGKPHSALSTFQSQIDRPSECDLVVCLFWKRLGTELPPTFNRLDGSARTGTEFEFEEALEAARQRDPGSPDILVYRKSAPVTFSEESVDEERAEKRALDAFWRRWFRSEEGHFLAAFETFDTPDQFARVFERALRGWLERRFRRTDWDIAFQGSPFCGLETFDEQHAAVFFGRRRATEQARASLMAAAQAGFPALFVLGASGAGKSSLARAALLPRLVRPEATAPLIARWRRTIATPAMLGDDLVLGLARAAVEAIGEIAEGDHKSADTLALLLRESPSSGALAIQAGLERWAARMRARDGFEETPRTGLIFLIDQFEELFARREEERRAFAAVLTAMVASGCVWLIATMRSDFYDSLQAAPELLALKARGRGFDLPPPSGADIREMILGPAGAAALSYESAGERDLADELEREAATPGALPMLQYALQALFEARSPSGQLSLAEYDRLGGAAGALAARAEAAFARLEMHAQEALPRVLGQLAHIDFASERATAIARTSPLNAFAPGTPERSLIDMMLAERLLIAFDEAGDGRVPARLRIVHESLFERWPRAAKCLAADRRDLDRRTQIERAAAEWTTADAARDSATAKGRLLEGLRLAEGRDLIKRRPDLLSTGETAFIAASDRAARTRSRRNGAIAVILIFALAGLAAAAGLFAIDAGRQRAEADRNLQVGIDAARAMTSDLTKDVKNTDGVQQKVLLRIQKQAQALLDKLSVGQVPTEEAEFAKADSLLQSIVAEEWAGDMQAALSDSKECLDIFLRLRASDPSSVEYESKSTECYFGIAYVEAAQNDLAGALENYRAALAIDQHLVSTDPHNVHWLIQLANAYLYIGGNLKTQGDRIGALDSFNAALATLEPVKDDLSNAAVQRLLSTCYSTIGDMENDQDDAKAALQNLQKGLDIDQRLVAANPADITDQENLGADYELIGYLQLQENDLEAAGKSNQMMFQIFEKLAKEDPSNARWQLRLASAYLFRVQLDEAQNQEGAAEADVSAALSIDRDLSARDPSDVNARFVVARDTTKLADVQVEVGKLAEALTNYTTAESVLAPIVAADDANYNHLWYLAKIHRGYGAVFQKKHDFKSARTSFETFRNLAQRLATLHRDDVPAKMLVLDSLEVSGDEEMAEGDAASAAVSFQFALEIIGPRSAAVPDNVDYQRNLAVDDDKLSTALEKIGDRKTAADYEDRAIAVTERIAALPSAIAADKANLASYRARRKRVADAHI